MLPVSVHDNVLYLHLTTRGRSLSVSPFIVTNFDVFIYNCVVASPSLSDIVEI